MISVEGSTKDDRKPMLELWGLSTDDKPIYSYGSLLIANGSIFHENDTSSIYRYSEGNRKWYKQIFRMYEDDDFKPDLKLIGLSGDHKPS